MASGEQAMEIGWVSTSGNCLSSAIMPIMGDCAYEKLELNLKFTKPAI
jgi:hypothetical protein